MCGALPSMVHPLRRTDADTSFRRPVLTVYEFLINIDLEVTTAWKHKKTVTTVLLLSIRWAMLINSIVLLVPTPAGMKVS